MASSKEYLKFVLDQLSSLDDISYKAMMGAFIIYYQGKIIGGICNGVRSPGGAPETHIPWKHLICAYSLTGIKKQPKTS